MPKSKARFRIGSVPFLNAKPLTWGLDRNPNVTLVYASPPRLKKMLETGRLDAALLSSIEFLRAKDRYVFVPGIGICSNGHVDSVRLYHRVPVAQIRRVALDRASLTARVLARIVLERKFGLAPRYVNRVARPGSFSTDAALVIGDASFRFSDASFLDLGNEWKALTGLPFVYAMWIYRRGARTPAALLRRAKREGERHLEEIARREADRLELDASYCKKYLRRCVRYDMGEQELAGLSRFEAYLKELP